MTKPTANEIVKLGRSQVGVKESPPNSNKTKYGVAFGWNGVSWCAIYSWWKGYIASKKVSSDNPIYKSASAANIQDLTVKCKGGIYILTQKEARKKKAREAMARRVMPSDLVSFDFGKYDCVRYHTGTADHIDGDDIYCNEGNTSRSGSQSNGGEVLTKKRHYNDICCVVRPVYKMPKPWSTDKDLPVDGDFGYQTRYRLQAWLDVTQDADLGPKTVRALQKKLGIKQDGYWCGGTTKALQKKIGATVDGDFGTQTIKRLQAYLNERFAKRKTTLEIIGEVHPVVNKDLVEVEVIETPEETVITETIVEEPTPTTKKKTKRERIVEECYKCAWGPKAKRKDYGYPNGHAKKQYKKDLKKAYGKRSGWRAQTKAGASCDVAAAAIPRALGIDKKFTRCCDYVVRYLKSDRGKKKWKCLKEKSWKKWKPGTFFFQKYNSGASHIGIYLGGGWVYNAHYCKKTYPRIERAKKIIKKEKNCRVFKAFVPR